MKFNDLSDKEKIRHIKDKYMEIIGEVKLNKAALDKMIPEIKEPAVVKSGNADAQEDYTKKLNEYNDNKAIRAKILELISKLKEKEGCICEPREVDIDINYIAPEFEVFIDFARTRAEAGNYADK